jgi:hypothetical protein
MADDNIVRTYGDVSKRESVLSLVTILTAEEKGITSMLGTTKAISTTHSTQLDTLKTPGSSAVAEGASYTNLARTTPTRLTNVLEIVAIPFSVSRTEQAVQHYNGENELSRQTKKGLMEYANDVEFDLVRSTLVSGISGAVPKMNGLIAHISKSSNTTAQTSGTVWSASIMKGLMKANMDNSNGNVATDIFLGSFLKDLTDNFTNKVNTVSTGTNVREVVQVVDIFETGLGKLKTHYHRYVQVAGTDLTGRVLAIRPDVHQVAYLEEPYVDKDLARTGPADNYAVTGTMTLATRNQDSNFFASGYSLV